MPHNKNNVIPFPSRNLPTELEEIDPFDLGLLDVGKPPGHAGEQNAPPDAADMAVADWDDAVVADVNDACLADVDDACVGDVDDSAVPDVEDP